MPAKSFTVELQPVQKKPAAKQAFASMSSTHRREYVEWVEEAKRPETRTRRIAATVARVRGGRPHR